MHKLLAFCCLFESYCYVYCHSIGLLGLLMFWCIGLIYFNGLLGIFMTVFLNIFQSFLSVAVAAR